MKHLYFKAILICLCLLWNITAFARIIQSGNLFYTLSGNTATVFAGTYRELYNDHTDVYEISYEGATNIVIPESVSYNGNTYSVTSITSKAFSGCNTLRSVSIPKSMTSIGYQAFKDCSSLNSVYINDLSSWCNISFGNEDANPLYYAHRLYLNRQEIKDLVIPEGVTSIGNFAFKNCNYLTSVTIPESLTSIGNYAFENCTRLNSIHITDLIAWCNISFKTIDANPLYYAHRLYLNRQEIKDLVIPEGVTSIGNFAFSSCCGLASITIPESLTSIGKNAFYGCYFTSNSFINYSTLTSSTHWGATLYNGLETKEGLLIINRTTLKCRPWATTVTIPDSVTSINSSAFSDCSNLASITIGRGVSSIESQFSNCSNLISITIGAGVLSIGNNAFNGTSLKKVIWLTNTPPTGYNNVNGTINYVANNQYTNLSNVTIYPFLSSLFEVNGVKYVPVSPSERTCDAIDCAYNDSVENINIGETVTNNGVSLKVMQVNPYLCYDNPFVKGVNLSSKGDVGNYTFSNCSNLGEATISNQGDIGSRAFYKCTNLCKATIQNKGSIKDDTFSCCSALQTVELGESVTSLGRNTFKDCSKLNNIVIPDSVVSIGNNVFENCSAMTSVKIGNGANTIPTYAFNGCSSLQDVQIGTGVTSIGTYAFSGCSSLPMIKIPQNVTTISDCVFNSCTSLKTVLMNDGETNLSLGSNGNSPLFASCPLDSVYIGRNIVYSMASNNGYSPFYRNTSLRSVAITDRETEISPNEFYGCTKLQNFTIGDGVVSFGDWAFSGCSSLKSLSFGSQLSSIGKEAFSDCTAVTQIVSRAATPPSCGDQALDDINRWNCTLFVPDGSLTTYQGAPQWKEFFFMEEFNPNAIKATGISLNKTTLSFNAANQTAMLTATVAPSNTTNKNVTWTSSNTAVATVSSIGVVTSKANGTAVITAKTTDGTNITATCNVTVSITDDTIINFADAKVKAICVAKWDTNGDGELGVSEAIAVTDLGSAFEYSLMSSFDELKFFTGLTSIGYSAFSDCTSLTSITIPNSVTSIGNYAFSRCTGLTSITIPSSVTSIGNYAFNECTGLTSITIGSGIASIGNCAFNKCTGLTAVHITDLVAWCNISFILMFEHSSNPLYYAHILYLNDQEIIDLVIPEGVTNISDYAFEGCSSLTSVTIPNSVTSIGNGVFSRCTGLTSITIPESVTSIDWHAFYDCSSLTSITIPNSVTSIGSGVFNECTSLTSITIPNSVTSIGHSAFSRCTGLTSITIPNSVTSIGNYAFYYCI